MKKSVKRFRISHKVIPNNKKSSRKILVPQLIITLLFFIIIIISIIGVFDNGSVTGKAVYNKPLTIDQLAKGVSLDAGSNVLVWTKDIKPVSIERAFSSIIDNILYVYNYDERKYWYNPNEKIVFRTNRLFYDVNPGFEYYIRLKNIDVLKFSCEDSDRGRNYNTKGIVTTGNGSIFKDACVNEKGLLSEFYCDIPSGFEVSSILYQCPNGCSDGMCVNVSSAGGEGGGGSGSLCSLVNNNIKNIVSNITAEGKKVILKEGDIIHYGDYVLVKSSNNNVHLLKLSRVKNSSSSYRDDSVVFLDILTGTLYGTVITSEGSGTVAIGGIVGIVRYYGNADNATEEYKVTLEMYPLDKVDDFTSCFASTKTKCTDSDNGLNYYVKGTAQGIFNGVPNSLFTDSCCSGDSCNSHTGEKLMETYCFGEQIRTQQYFCNCLDGACLYIGANQCSDGLDNDKDGKIDYPRDPGCLSVNDNNESDFVSSCSDSDGGINLVVKGIVNYTTAFGVRGAVDSCFGSTMVIENYCRNNQLAISYQYCPAGLICSDGACKTNRTFVP